MRPTTIATCGAFFSGLFAFAIAGQAAEFAVPAGKCDSAWSMASPGGETIEEGAAANLVLNFTMVDTNEDGTIEKDEFKKACSEGLVKADEATLKDME